MNSDLETIQAVGDAFASHWGVTYKFLLKLGVDPAVLADACAALTKVKEAADEKAGGDVTPNVPIRK